MLAAGKGAAEPYLGGGSGRSQPEGGGGNSKLVWGGHLAVGRGGKSGEIKHSKLKGLGLSSTQEANSEEAKKGHESLGGIIEIISYAREGRVRELKKKKKQKKRKRREKKKEKKKNRKEKKKKKKQVKKEITWKLLETQDRGRDRKMFTGRDEKNRCQSIKQGGGQTAGRKEESGRLEP